MTQTCVSSIVMCQHVAVEAVSKTRTLIYLFKDGDSQPKGLHMSSGHFDRFQISVAHICNREC